MVARSVELPIEMNATNAPMDFMLPLVDVRNIYSQKIKNPNIKILFSI